MKTDKISLYELGEEYEKHAKMQQFFIDKCKEDIEKAKKSGDYDAKVELERKLRVFKEIKSDLEHTAEKLKNYYKNEGEIHEK